MELKQKTTTSVCLSDANHSITITDGTQTDTTTSSDGRQPYQKTTITDGTQTLS